jgi:hypothetical protein
MASFATLLLMAAGASSAPSADQFAAAYFLACPVNVKLGKALERIEPGSSQRYTQASEFDRAWAQDLRDRAFALLDADARAVLPASTRFETSLIGKLGEYDTTRHGFPIRLFWMDAVARYRCGFRLDKALEKYGIHACDNNPSHGEFIIRRGDTDDAFWPVEEAAARKVATDAGFASAGSQGPVRIVGLQLSYELSQCRVQNGSNQLLPKPVAFEVHHARTTGTLSDATLFGPAIGHFDAAGPADDAGAGH